MDFLFGLSGSETTEQLVQEKQLDEVRKKFSSLNSCQLDKVSRSFTSEERNLLMRITQNSRAENDCIKSKRVVHLSNRLKEIAKLEFDYDIVIQKKDNSSGLELFFTDIIDWIAFNIFNYCSSYRFDKFRVDQFAKKLTHKDSSNYITFEELKSYLAEEIQRVKDGKKISLKDLLKKRGKRQILRSMHFSDQIDFSGISFKGISFSNCSFVDFHSTKGQFIDCKFHSCKFRHFSFKDAQFRKVQFKQCCFVDGYINQSFISHGSFSKCHLDSVNIENTKFLTFEFLKSSITLSTFSPILLTDLDFVDCQINESVFIKSNNSYNFIDSEVKERSKSVAGILVDPANKGLSGKRMQQKASSNILLRLDFTPEELFKDELNSEVEQLLKVINSDQSHAVNPIPQRLIREVQKSPEKYPHSTLILNRVKSYIKEVDMVILPGGDADIPPSFYSEEKHHKSDWDNDYKRALMEIFLIHLAKNRGIPIAGICRGFQAVAIYNGASLIQHVGWEFGLQRFTFEGNENEKPITGFVWHHQGVDPERPPVHHIKPNCYYNNMIKSCETKIGGSSPMLLLQFHPEFFKPNITTQGLESVYQYLFNNFLSKRNNRFWDDLNEAGKQHQKKRNMLKELKSKVIRVD